MAGKGAKTKKGRKKVVLKKPPKVKPSVKKTKAQIEKQLALKEARGRARILKSALLQVRAQIKAERAQGVPDISVLRAEVAAAQSRLEQVQSELKQAKALSRKRKNEIDEWKAWYKKLPDAEEPAGLVSLQNEIDWRAAELNANGQTINQLMLSEIEAAGTFELAQQKLAAFEAGVYKLPVEKDPRLKNALAEVEKAVAEVKKLAPKKPKKPGKK